MSNVIAIVLGFTGVIGLAVEAVQRIREIKEDEKKKGQRRRTASTFYRLVEKDTSSEPASTLR
jgi:hypothetical protein